MSAIQDTAQLEAAIGEADLTDEQAELVKQVHAEGVPVEEAIAAVLAESQPDAPDQADRPPTGGEPTAEQLGKLEKELNRHEKAVHQIMGDHVEGFVPCDECGGVGIVAPTTEAVELAHHEWFRECATCNGFGTVLTGSKVPGQATTPCPTCGGRGFEELLSEAGVPMTQAQGAAAVPTLATSLEPSEADAAGNGAASGVRQFGRPSWLGDPNIGAAS